MKALIASAALAFIVLFAASCAHPGYYGHGYDNGHGNYNNGHAVTYESGHGGSYYVQGH